MILRVLSILLLSVGVAHAQSMAEKHAQTVTKLEGIQFIPGMSAVELSGMKLAYVDKDVKPENGRYTCSALDEETRNEAAKEARKAFEKIGARGLSSSGVRYILLCNHATEGEQEISGFSEPRKGLMMLATSSKDSATISSRFGITALHEFYRYLELSKSITTDAQWDAQFSGYDKSYGNGLPSTRLGSGGDRFINALARTYPQEDRAELFAYIVYDTKMVLNFLERTKSPVFAQKIGEIVERCQKFLKGDVCR